MGKLITDGADNGGYWDVTLAGFASPRYLTAPNVAETDDKGFSIAGAGMLVLSFENGFTATVAHEQTNDPTGAAGWFGVIGRITDNPVAAPSSAAVSGKAYVFPALGVRHRLRTTALTVADMRVRIMASDQPFDIPTGSVALGTSSSSIGAVSSPLNEDAAIAAASSSGLIISGEAHNVQKAAMSANADKVNLQATMDGRLVHVPYAIPELSWYAPPVGSGGINNSTADQLLKAAAGAGIRNYLTAVQISHDTLGGVVDWVIKDGATIIYRGRLQTAGKEDINVIFPTPLKSSANTALNFALFSATTGGVYCNAQGYSAP